MTKKKWFYESQERASKILDTTFKEVYQCCYQMVSKDRVIEGFIGRDKDGDGLEIEVHYIKRSNEVVTLVFTLSLTASLV